MQAINGATPAPGVHGTDAAKALDALHRIPPDLPRDEWVKVGMGAHAAGLDFDAFDAWSAGADNYDARAARDTWRSFKAGKGVGAGTLFRVAAEHGQPMHRPLQAPRKAAAPPQKPAPGMAPAEVWARCQPATAGHPYVLEKGISGAPLEELRVLPAGDSLRIAGQSMAGALVVPAHGPHGLQSLQLIPPPGAGKKLNLPGALMAGASFVVGEALPGAPLYLCEGVGAAWACWQATGHAAAVCFGWGNVARIAADLRQKDAAARLVIVPDTGKEESAAKIALEAGCAVAYMPEGEANNFDANDLSMRDGHDVLAELLERAQAPAKPAPEPHPLSEFVSLCEAPTAPRWVIPGFIGHGVTTIAGAHGVGKTTALLPLAMIAAGLHKPGDPLAPQHWRHVIYIVEELEQAQRIISGLVKHGNPGFDWQTMCERLHIVEARRLPPDYVAKVGAMYRERFTRHVDGVDVLPLVVIDTMAATLEIESENDNSEASRAMAALKQGFDRLPVWLVGHLAKANLSRSDTQGLTLRGAGAFEADANQVLYLVKEGEARYLVRGKTRFEARWTELEIQSDFRDVPAQNEYGTTESVRLRWATVAPPQQTRTEAALEAREGAATAADMELRQCVRDAVQTACVTGTPLNREGVKSTIKRKASDVARCMELLIAERWLIEIDVPREERQHPRRASFIVGLSTTEREAFLRGEPLPPEKTAVPATWKKQVISSIPEKTAPDVKSSQK